MRALRRLVLSGAIIGGLAACDPAVALHARQRIVPQIGVECARAALDSSPDLSWVSPPNRDAGWSLELALRDPTPVDHLRSAYLYHDPGGLWTLKFTWGGRWRAPPEREELAVTALAKRLFTRIRNTCAPDASEAIECVYPGTGKHAASCAPAT